MTFDLRRNRRTHAERPTPRLKA